MTRFSLIQLTITKAAQTRFYEWEAVWGIMTEEITSIKTYGLVWIALLVLTVSTYAIAFLDLGPWNAVAALGIAAIKAILVALFFMHARFSKGMTRAAIVGGLLWLGILIVGTMDDVITRGLLGAPGK